MKKITLTSEQLRILIKEEISDEYTVVNKKLNEQTGFFTSFKELDPYSEKTVNPTFGGGVCKLELDLPGPVNFMLSMILTLAPGIALIGTKNLCDKINDKFGKGKSPSGKKEKEKKEKEKGKPKAGEITTAARKEFLKSGNKGLRARAYTTHFLAKSTDLADTASDSDKAAAIIKDKNSFAKNLSDIFPSERLNNGSFIDKTFEHLALSDGPKKKAKAKAKKLKASIAQIESEVKDFVKKGGKMHLEVLKKEAEEDSENLSVSAYTQFIDSL